MSRLPRRPHACGLLPFVAALLFVACGGGGDPTSTPTTTTPPTPPPTPAPTPVATSATATEGDRQTAAAGSAVPVAPTVVVRDQSGSVMAGVQVVFSVTAGGGSTEGATATTDAAGVARVGRWTLGPVGEQRLTARVGALTPVEFVATLVPGSEIFDVPVGPDSGTFEIRAAGLPSRGFPRRTPSGAFATASAWSVRLADSAVIPSLPAGFSVAGPALEIRGSTGLADQLLTLNVPLPRVPGRRVVLALRDPVRGVLDIMPMVARSDSTARVLTLHLDGSRLIGPTSGTASRPGTVAAQTVPVAQIVPIALPPTLPTVGPVITPETERWPVQEYGTYYQPDGHGPAIPLVETVASADGGAPLGGIVRALSQPGLYAEIAPIGLLSELTERISSSTNTVVREVAAQLQLLTKSERDALVHDQAAAALAIGQRAVTLAFLPAGGGDPTYGTGVAASGSNLGLLQPASSGVESVDFSAAQGYATLLSRATADEQARQTQQLAILSSMLVDKSSVEQMLSNLRSHDRLTGPARDASNDAIAPRADLTLPRLSLSERLGVSTGVTRGGSVAVRSPLSTLGVEFPGVQGLTAAFLESTQESLTAAAGATVPLGDLLGRVFSTPGTRTRVVITSVATINGQTRQIAAFVLELVDAPFRVAPDTTFFDGTVPAVTLTASIPEPPAGYRVRWPWGDGNSPVQVGSPSATHQYAEERDYTIVATLRDQDGVTLATDTAYARAGRPYWRLTSMTDPDGFLEVGEPGESPTYDLLARVLAAPTSGLLAIDAPDSTSTVLRLRVLTAAVGDTTQCRSPPRGGSGWGSPPPSPPASGRGSPAGR